MYLIAYFALSCCKYCSHVSDMEICIIQTLKCLRGDVPSRTFSDFLVNFGFVHLWHLSCSFISDISDV